MLTNSVVVCLALLALAAATDVKQCNGRDYPDLQDNVILLKCTKAPCKLKKGKTQEVAIAFIPKTDMEDIVNDVNAIVAGIPLPFIGVDGNSVCSKLFLENGEAASCPLKAGTKYVYKDSFPIYNFYPSISTTVNWALKHGKTEVTCFKVAANIV